MTLWRSLISLDGEKKLGAMSRVGRIKNIFKKEGESMCELEIVRQKCEVQKRKTAYAKVIRKQIKEKLVKIKNQYRGESN